MVLQNNFMKSLWVQKAKSLAATAEAKDSSLHSFAFHRWEDTEPQRDILLISQG